jgi:hypothetical protein
MPTISQCIAPKIKPIPQVAAPKPSDYISF